MPLTLKLETVVFTVFYLVLIAVLIVPLLKLLNSPTAFEEFQIGNEAELPSITICPFPKLGKEYSQNTLILVFCLTLTLSSITLLSKNFQTKISKK